MHDRETTIRSRELGDGLRAAMTEAGFTGAETAYRLGWSESRISRLINGKRGCDPVDVSALLAVCGLKGRERTRLLNLSREQATPGWLQQHGGRLPKQLRTLIDHEDKAVSIEQFQPIVVPGLLQTGDYARALLTGTGTLPTGEIEDRVLARMERQTIFGRSPHTRFTFFLHEFALRLPVGGNDTMCEQLHHLLRMSVRPNVRLRVVPAAAGVHAGIAGAFTLLRFAEFKPIVYLDSETASLFLEESVEIVAYGRILERLAADALDGEQSRGLIAELAMRLYS